jgi:hypothetical protein
MVLLKGPWEAPFLMSEVLLQKARDLSQVLSFQVLQGYLAHKKVRFPLGSP